MGQTNRVPMALGLFRQVRYTVERKLGQSQGSVVYAIRSEKGHSDGRLGHHRFGRCGSGSESLFWARGSLRVLVWCVERETPSPFGLFADLETDPCVCLCGSQRQTRQPQIHFGVLTSMDEAFEDLANSLGWGRCKIVGVF